MPQTTIASSQSHRLFVVKESRERDNSSEGNSSTHAEHKHAITVKRNKTPKIGVHMKTISVGMGRKITKNSPPAQVPVKQLSMKHLLLPGQNITRFSTASTARAQLSTAHQSNSARSSEFSSDKQLSSQGSTEDMNMEGIEFKSTPRDIMQQRWLKVLS